MKYVTIIPASGFALRIMGIPKFLLPLYNSTLLKLTLDKFKNIKNNTIIIPTQPKYVPILYEHINDNKVIIIGTKTNTMSETVKNIRGICNQNISVLSMPDSYFKEHCFEKMLSIVQKPEIDICLGLWRIKDEQKGKLGQCQFNSDFMLQDIVDKDPSCTYEWAWGVVCWKPVLWDYIDPKTPHIGYAVKSALKNNCKIYCHLMNSRYYDCGTLNEYQTLLAKSLA